MITISPRPCVIKPLNQADTHSIKSIIEEEREYRTLIFKMLSKSCASNIVHACVSIKFMLQICAYGHVTLHFEFQRGILQVRYSVSSIIIPSMIDLWCNVSLCSILESVQLGFIS